ncbi:hypothetical protein [Arthrobacter sp. ISL-95]|uniref:hypothetical protein n=1 Tax=Arthrobacter sp. ISL-95 TaxID=2819116 RepID=UPI001BECD449|nr:hypothetical protein [Arthrobacter sp. ISL-95]MBT2587946.1 hypothetical protein [Arthrobacter sp. ISL-95]
MVKSRLLDRGRESLIVYVEETVTDSFGNVVKRPSGDGVTIRCTSSEDRSSDAELNGQVSNKVVRILARQVPAGSWSRIIYDGEEWDLASPPRMTTGATDRLKHIEFTIRSRNKLQVDG